MSFFAVGGWVGNPSINWTSKDNWSYTKTQPFQDNDLNALLCVGRCKNLVRWLNSDQLFATPWTAVHQASLSFNIFWSLLKLMSIESEMPSNHLIFCHPLLLPSVFPSIRVFSNESVLCNRWPKYWSFSISPPNECRNLGSFKLFLRYAFSLSKDLYIQNTERFLFSLQAHWDQRLQWLQTWFQQNRNCTQRLFFLYRGNWHLFWHKE